MIQYIFYMSDPAAHHLHCRAGQSPASISFAIALFPSLPTCSILVFIARLLYKSTLAHPLTRPGIRGPLSHSSFVLCAFALAQPFDKLPSRQSLIRILLFFVFALANPRLP